MKEGKRLKQITAVLSQVIGDTTVPRNIRRSAEEAKNILLNEKEDLNVRVSSALYILEEISNDRNLPIHARSLIWNVASELETIKL
ncbi:MAG: UPF0147 family protein [Candidatus Hydrothermarchaeota archaeon]|nr:UPF0147 family protein [Candidatus Hydrothermarchaeota archaeon]